MKTLTTLVVLFCLILPATAFAQGGQVTPAGYMSSTTLNGAISATQTTLVLTSASALSGSSYGAPAAGQCLLLDRELMTITAMSSTTATVRRATGGVGPGGAASPHATLTILVTGPCNGNRGGFMRSDPPTVGGNQDCTQFVLPWINIMTGDFWWCDLQTKGVGTLASGAQGGQWSRTGLAVNSPVITRRVAQ